METIIRELWLTIPDLRAEIAVLAREKGLSLRQIEKITSADDAYIHRLSKQTDPQTAAQLLTQAAIDGKITLSLIHISEPTRPY